MSPCPCALSLCSADGRAQGTDDYKALTARIDALSRQGKYAEAIEIAEQALALAENKNSPEHEELASALDKLAFLYRRQGRYAEAEPLYERELSIRQNEQGGKKSDLSVLLNGLADVYEKRGRMDDAVTLRQQSLTLVEAASGADDTAVRVLRGNLAGLYERLDRYQDAIPLRERNLVLTEMKSPQAGYLFLPEIDALAADYQRVRRLTEAETLYRRALALGEKTLNANNPLLSKMFRCCENRGDRGLSSTISVCRQHLPSSTALIDFPRRQVIRTRRPGCGYYSLHTIASCLVASSRDT